MNKFSMRLYCFALMVILVCVIAVSADSNTNIITRAINISDEIKGNYSIAGEIRFVSKSIEVGNAETRRYPFDDYVIILDSGELSSISDEELRGLLAHEMVHLEDYSRIGWIGVGFLALRYVFSDNFKRNYERAVDARTIEKGFGKELLAFREYDLGIANEKEAVVFRENYLSPEEIRGLI